MIWPSMWQSKLYAIMKGCQIIALAIDQGQEHGAQIRQKHRYISITSALSWYQVHQRNAMWNQTGAKNNFCTEAMSSIRPAKYNLCTNIPAPAPSVIAQSPFKQGKSYIIPVVFNNTKKWLIFKWVTYLSTGFTRWKTASNAISAQTLILMKARTKLPRTWHSSFKMKGKGWRGECTCQHILLNHLDTKCVP